MDKEKKTGINIDIEDESVVLKATDEEEELEFSINKKKNKNKSNEIDELKKEIEKLNEEIIFQKSLRNADIANLTKKRNEQEALVRKFAPAGLATDLIKPFDLLKKVVESPASSPEVQNYLVGFNMVVNQFQNAFETNGIIPMGVKVNDEFDSNIHEANELVESPDFESNKVISVISDGYKIHDRVLVHAIVKVSK